MGKGVDTSGKKRGPGRPREDEKKGRPMIVAGLAAGETKEVSLAASRLASLQKLAKTNDATVSDAAVAVLLPQIGRKIKGAVAGASVEITMPPALWAWVEAVGGLDAALGIAGVE